MFRRTFLATAVAAALLVTGSAQGARDLKLGVFDGDYASTDASIRAQALERTTAAGADLVLIVATWSSIAPASPPSGFDAADAGDPGYDWTALDNAVRDAAAHGLAPLILVTSAPPWAEGSGGQGAPPGTWKPDPGAVSDFGRAIAARYRGGYPAAGGSLPRAAGLQLWAEPNLPRYLNPQWEDGRAEGAIHYRRMLNAFYSGVKGADSDAVVVTGGTGPYGDRRGTSRTRPLVFWREVLCLKKKGKRKLQGTDCPEKARFHVLAHHPINTSGGPRQSAVHPDDVSTPDLRNLRRTLRVAERKSKVGGPKRHQLWATEIWWESDPPDRFRGVGLKRHARWIEEALYMLWKQGARVVINFQIRDDAYDPGAPLATFQSGLYFRDGKAKPALQAFRFPFVTERSSKRKVRAWGRAPAGGKLVIQRKARTGWQVVTRRRVGEGETFKTSLSIGGKEKLRAKVGGHESLVWKQRG